MDLVFEKDLIPVVVQESSTREVLMVAYTNKQAINLSQKTGYAHYFSRSRNKIWRKGEESGHIQHIVRILVDCDADCLLYEVEQVGAACHTGHRSCFFRSLGGVEINERIVDPAKVYHNKDQ